MKLESLIVRLATLALGLFVCLSAQTAVANGASEASNGGTRTLSCELEDSTFHDIIDRNSQALDSAHVLFLLGGMDVMATVRDVAQEATGDRQLTLTIAYRGGMGEGIGHAETTYLVESTPLNTTLAEASIDLAPSERRYSIRCFLQ